MNALQARLAHHGFAFWHTGGNGTAYARVRDLGGMRGLDETMITIEGTDDAPTSEEQDVMVGHYQSEEVVSEWHGKLGDYLMVLDVMEARLGRDRRLGASAS